MSGELFRAFDGPLTAELRRVPGGFGLGQVPERTKADALATIVCGFCSTGCGLTTHLRGGAAEILTPAPDYPVNLRHGLPERLGGARACSRPPTARPRRCCATRAAGSCPSTGATRWSLFVHALQGDPGEARPRLGRLPQHRADRRPKRWRCSARSPSSAWACCTATATRASAWPRRSSPTSRAFGFDAPPYTYDDFEESDVIVLVGSNLCIAHPILWQRICRNPHRPRDHRRRSAADRDGDGGHAAPAAAAEVATCAVLRPGAPPDPRRLDRPRVHRRAHDRLRGVRASTSPSSRPSAWPRRPASTPATLLAIARHRFTRASASRSGGRWASTRATRACAPRRAIINLALMTGNIGRPGTGANSITGQCNAMGSRLFSNTTNLLGGRDFTNAEHRREGRGDPGHRSRRAFPTEPSWAYDQIIEGILRGQDQRAVGHRHEPGALLDQPEHAARRARRGSSSSSCRTCTTPPRRPQLADLVLPAAGWGEKEGTFINSERRIGLIKKVRRAPGQALADFRDLPPDRRGLGLRRDVPPLDRAPRRCSRSCKQLSRGQPCDITGIADYRDARRARRHPVAVSRAGASASRAAERRLFADGRFYHRRRQARFLFDEPAPMPEPPTRALSAAAAHRPRHGVAVAHADAHRQVGRAAEALPARRCMWRSIPPTPRRAAFEPNQRVVVESQRGELRAQGVRDAHRASRARSSCRCTTKSTNRLTLAHFDPHSRQPSYKDCAVRVRPLASGRA